MGKTCGCQKNSTKNLAKNHNLPGVVVVPCKHETKLSAQLQYAVTGEAWTYSLSTSQNGDTCEQAKANSEAAAVALFHDFLANYKPKISKSSYSLVSTCVENCDTTPWALEAVVPATFTFTPVGVGEWYDVNISMYPFEGAPIPFLTVEAEGVSLAGQAATSTRAINFTMSTTSIDADLAIGSGTGAAVKKVVVQLDREHVNNPDYFGNETAQFASITARFDWSIEKLALNIAIPLGLTFTTTDEAGINRQIEFNSLRATFGGFGSEKGIKGAAMTGQILVVLAAAGVWLQ